jgi:hypothetical protein
MTSIAIYAVFHCTELNSNAQYFTYSDDQLSE